MALEIERKFIVNPQKLPESGEGDHYIQGYLDPSRMEVRVRITPNGCMLTFKSNTPGLIRSEHEFSIQAQAGQALLDDLGDGALIDKHRTAVEHAGRTWDVDHFHGENEGLITAEVEMESEDETVSIPDWAALEVTGEARYANSYLAKHPYTTWSPSDKPQLQKHST